MFYMWGLGSDQKQFKSTAACASPVVKRLEFLPSPVPSEEAASSEKDVKKPEMEQQKEAELPATPEVCMGKKGEGAENKTKKERSHTEVFIVQVGIFLYIMSLQEFIENNLPGNDPGGWFLCQILWSSESSPSKGTLQCLLVAFKPVNWLEQK